VRSKKTISLVFALVLMLTGAALRAEDQGAAANSPEADIPAVPAKIMAAIDQINLARQSSGKQKSPVNVNQEGNEVKVESGRNIILAVAGGHLNRLITPFEDPVVHTVSKAKINVEGSVIYASLALDDGPTTMFVTERSDSDPALSLTLVPKAIPPREIRLTLESGGSVMSFSGKSVKWEKSQPYIEALEKVILETARGQVPPGYSLRYPVNYDPLPRCRLPVQVESRQVLEGHNFIVVVSRLTNVSSESLLVDESSCYQEGVRAVAVWPQVRLSPKESTELYIVYQRDFGKKPRVRPNVLHMATNQADQPEGPKKGKRRSRPEPLAASLEEDSNNP